MAYVSPRMPKPVLLVLLVLLQARKFKQYDDILAFHVRPLS